jgi:hypothetical protein
MDDATRRRMIQAARWYRYFVQGTHWVPNGKPPLAIADMELTHRYNCVRYLERNAAKYATVYIAGCHAEMWAQPTMPDEVVDALWNDASFAKADPTAWIKTTCLYRAMAADLPPGGRPMRKLAEKAKHWGECEKRTRPNKGVCTCAELAARDRREREIHEAATAAAMAEAALS